MIITEQELFSSNNYSDSNSDGLIYLDESETVFNPIMAPIVENANFDRYLISQRDITKVSESYGCTYTDALNYILEVNNLTFDQTAVEIDESDIILRPGLETLYENNIIINPISDFDPMYEYLNEDDSSDVDAESLDPRFTFKGMNTRSLRRELGKLEYQKKLIDKFIARRKYNASNPTKRKRDFDLEWFEQAGIDISGSDSIDSVLSKITQKMLKIQSVLPNGTKALKYKPPKTSNGKNNKNQNNSSNSNEDSKPKQNKNNTTTPSTTPTTLKFSDEEENDTNKTPNIDEPVKDNDTTAIPDTKLKSVQNTKDPNIIARAIAALRKKYRNFMLQNKDNKNAPWYKRWVAKILSWIDRLTSRLQYLTDRRKGSEMSEEDKAGYRNDEFRYNRTYDRL